MHIADTEMAANNAELQMPTFAWILGANNRIDFAQYFVIATVIN